MNEIIKRTREYVLVPSISGGFHGGDHWDRVYHNGQRLLTPEVRPIVVGLFACLHDSCRIDDGEDLDHGPRAADYIEVIRDSLLKEVCNEDIELLKKACRHHTVVEKTGNPTIDACFDADRLDLGRVGINPDPDRMATEKGKEIALSFVG